MPVRQQAADLAVRWRLNGDVNPLGHLMKLLILTFRKFLGNAGKSLICHGFGKESQKLWITLLKTPLVWSARLDFQAFGWIAHHLSKKLKVNKNKDLGEWQRSLAGAFRCEEAQKADSAFCA
jgi:hypothetical protein